MSIIFSRQCEYALQATSYLALKPAGEMTSIKELTKKLAIPYHFLGKIMQDLTYKGLLTSQKGPTGGFALAMPAHEITLFHIVDAIDGNEFLHKCVMGFPECTGKNPCAVHEKWGGLRDGIYTILVGRNIAQIAKDMKKPEFRLMTD
jgi:Rrf2 family iron-sulfur cluster assembly transcriptional regulator